MTRQHFLLWCRFSSHCPRVPSTQSSVHLSTNSLLFFSLAFLLKSSADPETVKGKGNVGNGTWGLAGVRRATADPCTGGTGSRLSLSLHSSRLSPAVCHPVPCVTVSRVPPCPPGKSPMSAAGVYAQGSGWFWRWLRQQ